ncbi:Uncharacterised protein [Burkholderia pseudomallei]|nr:Uncharacterised protein [Burkholderia pseudomallei]
MHLHDDPVDVAIARCAAQRLLEPARLLAAAVAAHVQRRAGGDRLVAGARRRHERVRARDERGCVLIDDVVRVERHEQHRADAEAVPAARKARAVLRQGVAREIRIEALRAVVEFDFVIAGARHPRAVRGGRLVVVAEIAPHGRLVRGIEVRVAEVAVQQVKERLEALDRLHREAALRRGQHPARVRRRQVAIARPAKRRAAARRGLEARGERLRRVGVVIGRDLVAIDGARLQAAQPRVIREHDFAVQAVGVRALHAVNGAPRFVRAREAHARVRRGRERRPRHDHFVRVGVAPGQMNLLGRAVGRGGRRARDREAARGAREPGYAGELEKAAARDGTRLLGGRRIGGWLVRHGFVRSSEDLRERDDGERRSPRVGADTL